MEHMFCVTCLQLESVDIALKRAMEWESLVLPQDKVIETFVYYSNCILSKLGKNKLPSYFFIHINSYFQVKKGCYDQKSVIFSCTNEQLKYMYMEML